MQPEVIGLDIGGANLKAAMPDGSARSQPFELWKQPHRLGAGLQDLLRDWTVSSLAITMTGEMCDCFENRRDGVDRILAEVESAFPGMPISVWSTAGRFVSPGEARQDWLRVAASNWHALATFVGKLDFLQPLHSVLLIDIGSTTSDIIPISNGLPIPKGYTDSQRLQSKELVYTGVRRTPICSFAIDGLAAELFATTHDAYLRLGYTHEDPNDFLTADGRPATMICADARLARMLGGDSELTLAEHTQYLAERVVELQEQNIVEAIAKVSSCLPSPPEAVIMLGSGIGLAQKSWQRYVESTSGEHLPKVYSLAKILGPVVSSAACAYAVAVLSAESGRGGR